MKPILCSLALVLSVCWIQPAEAQTASELNEGSKLTHDSVNNTWSLTWWARSGRTYFIQQSEDLIHWNYIPIIETGSDAVAQWGFSTDASRLFFRLKHTDIPTGDPVTADYDGDGVSNMVELMQQTDPFKKLTAGQPFPDDWTSPSGLEPNAGDLLGEQHESLYAYDDAGRLTSFAVVTTTAVTMAMDEEGNIINTATTP